MPASTLVASGGTFRFSIDQINTTLDRATDEVLDVADGDGDGDGFLPDAVNLVVTLDSTSWSTPTLRLMTSSAGTTTPTSLKASWAQLR